MDTEKPPEGATPQQMASQQFKQNQKFGQQQASFNRVNQSDQFGNSLNYVQTGKDAKGNPIYSANQSLGATGQQYATGLAGLGQQYFGQAGNVSGLGSNDAFDRAYGYASANLEPRFQRTQDQTMTQLRNQGLDPTSEAYKSSMNDLALQQNEARNNLVTGLQGQMFNQGLQQRQQGMSELQPGVQFGNNVLNPSYAQVPQVSLNQPDMGGLNAQHYQTQMNAYNANQAQRSGMLGGLASIGGSILTAPMTGGGSLIGNFMGGLGR